jgi:hypothetical protein
MIVAMATLSESAWPAIGMRTADRRASARSRSAVLLAAHDDRERTAQIGVGVERRWPRAWWRRRGSLFAQPGVHPRAFLDHARHREEHAGRGADDVGVENIRHRIAHDHGVDSRRRRRCAGWCRGCRVSRWPRPRAETGGGGQREVGQRAFPLRRHGEQAVGPFAVGDLGESLLRSSNSCAPACLGLRDERRLVLPEKPLGGIIELLQGDAFFQPGGSRGSPRRETRRPRRAAGGRAASRAA